VLDYHFTNQFKKDFKSIAKRGKNLDKIIDVIASLIWEEPLPTRCREHKLHGDWDDFMECHVEGDWVIIYRKEEGVKISFSCTGTHSDYL